MTRTQSHIAVLILAAGASRRMGRPKQLLAWSDTTLLGNAIENAKASNAHEVIVVVGAKAEFIRREATKHYVPTVQNDDWEQGMGSSIICGLSYLLQQRTAYTGVLILLADQPLIDTAYLNKMMQCFQDGTRGIVATKYNEKAGVPALFGNSYFEPLQLLNQEYGAKTLLKMHTKDTLLLDAGNKISDIDTPEDYHGLRTGDSK